VQFDPTALKQSVRRLLEVQPDCVYLTHYGRVEEVQRLAGEMIDGIDVLAGIGEQLEFDDSRGEKIAAAMTDWLLARLRAHGVALPEQECLRLLQADITLNASGIECWLDYRRR
jgi:hypothetical protein